MSNIGPISPTDVADARVKIIPEYVYKAFNELIVRNFKRAARPIRVPIEDVIPLIISYATAPITRADLYKSGWLDIESVYESAGWKVTYNSDDKNYVFTAIQPC